ncbi:unnamed protein product, partial [Lymnaea stagnalis]
MKSETDKVYGSEFKELHPPEHFQRTKRRSLKQPKSVSSSDTSGVPHDASHVLPSDLDLSATSAGSEPPPHKSKHRVKLWNSFLNKTKHIRIRRKDKSPSGPDKLHRRSSSQPNIPINITPSNHAVTNKDSGRAPKLLSNGTDAGHVVADSKRTEYRKQKDELSRSSSSLNDSTFTSLSGAAKVRGAPGRYSDSIEDDSYGSLVERTSSAAYRSVSDPTLTPERQARLDSYHNGRRKLSKAPSIDKEDEDDDEGEDDKENDEAEDDVPVLIQSLPVDSSLVPVSHHLSQPRSFFTVHVHLKEGRDLVIRDACGTSDPYVKFKIGGKVVYKSRIIYKNLNPRWEEKFTIPIEDITKPITIKVFDYDRAWN